MSYVVLVTDFANVHTVYGPFDTEEAGHTWVEHSLRQEHAVPIYRVFEMKAPTEANAANALGQADV